MKTKISIIAMAIVLLGIYSCKKKKDTVPPVITLKGKSLDRVLYPKHYVDPGATATDDVDGDISSKIVAQNNIDYNNPNINYDIAYSITDAAGNTQNADRIVLLINLASQFSGSAGTLGWSETPNFSVGNNSDTLRFQEFAGYQNAAVTAIMPTDSTLTIAAQTVTCGNTPQTPRTFSGTGTLSYARSGPAVKTIITVNYTQVANGNTTTGVITYKN